MKEIKKINGELVDVYSTEFTSANILEVKAGTTGVYNPNETDNSGAHTYFALNDIGSTQFEINKTRDGVEIILIGDTELETFIKALKYAVKVLSTHYLRRK